MSDSPNSKQVGLRVNRDTYEALAIIARVEDSSIGKVAAKLVAEGINSRKNDPDYVHRVQATLKADMAEFGG